jgi:glycosyltransferase involved in cell wall biosynthesis
MIVFFGTYLSHIHGTKGPSEAWAREFSSSSLKSKLVSKNTNILLRFYDSLITALTAKIDIAILDVYSSRVIFQTFVICKILELRKIKTIAVLHGGGLVVNFEKIKKYLLPILQHSNRIITPSLFLKSNIEYLSGYIIQYIPNPINLDNFKLKADRVIKADKVKLLWVRAFSNIYQPHLAVDILFELSKKGIQVELTMIGPDKGLLLETKKHAEKLGVANFINFVGYVNNTELVSYYHSHDILINTTLYESFGVALVEAAACGLPCVSNNVGELPYLWSNDKNILLCTNDAFAFSNAIANLVADKEKYKEIAQEAVKFVQQFDINNILPTWQKLLSNELS